MLFLMTSQAWKLVLLNSMTFRDRWDTRVIQTNFAECIPLQLPSTKYSSCPLTIVINKGSQ